MQLERRPIVLIILDGWGYSESTYYNAIHSAHKPVWDKLWDQYPHSLISASGLDVGLPVDQMGNSEVGHMNIGSGRIVDQEFTRINHAIENGSFFENEPLSEAFTEAAGKQRAVHLLGLLSDGGVHSHLDHIFALMDLADQCGVEKIYLHAFLDGRDTPQKSAIEYIYQAQVKMRELGKGEFASIMGRHFAMDRNKRWERTRLAYDLISQGKGQYLINDAFVGVEMAYARGETDEFVSPTTIVNRKRKQAVRVEDGDVMVFANYRSDRARQLARAFTKDNFKSFERKHIPRLNAFISLTEYKSNYEFPVAFPAEKLENVFGNYIADLGLKQLRIAETEKYAHVTFFFNGGEERVFEGEDRILVPSPHVKMYSEQPEMSAPEVSERLVEAINSDKYDAIICNFANTDMVGHSGDYDAALKAVETVDSCLGDIISATKSKGGELLITADHGNAEQMRTFTTEQKTKGEPYTAHTNNLVPLIYIGRPAEFGHRNAVGVLSDICPTLLHLMDLDQPEEMTGHNLLKLIDESN